MVSLMAQSFVMSLFRTTEATECGPVAGPGDRRLRGQDRCFFIEWTAAIRKSAAAPCHHWNRTQLATSPADGPLI